MGEAPDRLSRQAQRHEETKRQILDAAWALSRERGVAGWSLREVAAVVGMRAPSLYSYFDSKDAIYDAMFAQGYEQFRDYIAEQEPDDDPAATLRIVARTFFEFCVRDPARHQLLFLRPVPGFVPSPRSYRLAREVLARLEALLKEAGMGGREACDLFTAVLAGLVSQQLSNDPGGDRWARLLDRAVDAFVAAESGARRS